MEDFLKQQAGWLNTWQDQQQKLTEQYAKWGEDLTKGVAGAAGHQIPANFEDMLKSQQALVEQFTSFAADLQKNIQQAWGDKLPTELLKQFNFNILREFYKSWLGNMKFPGGLQNPFMGGQNWMDPSSFLNSFIKQENPFFSVFSSRNLTDELQQLFGMLQGSKLAGGGLFSQLFTTYQDFFNQLANTGSRQGFDKLLETFSSWKDQTDKFLLAPQVGINRETAQDFSKAISLSLDYIQSFATMGKLMEETARKSGNRFQAKLVERSLNNEPPIEFSDFCSLWTKENEAVFLDVFGSEDYAKVQGEFTAAGFRLKIQINKLIEKVLDQTPIALKRDVDLASKEILQLKRELRQSRKQQQERAAGEQAAQKAVAVAEQRIQKLEADLAKVQAQVETATAGVTHVQELEAALAKVRVQVETATAGVARVQELEAALIKVQAQVETAEQATKSAVVQQSKPAPKAKAATTKKTTAATTKKTTTTAAKKTAATAAKKTATTAAKKTTGTRRPKTTSSAKKPADTSVE